jgi:hypothetical protein
MARCELAPGSPWNTIFFSFGMGTLSGYSGGEHYSSSRRTKRSADEQD